MRHHKQALNEAEIYRVLAQTMDGWEEWIGADGCVIFVFPSCQRFTGLPPETLLAAPERLLACIHPDDQGRFQEARARLLQQAAQKDHTTPDLKALEFRLVIDGSPRWFALRIVTATDDPATGKATHWPAARIRYVDIDAQKQAEEALRRERRAVQALINTPTDVFVLLDRDGTIVAANEFMATGLQRSLHDLLGKNVWPLYHPERRQVRQAAFERVLASGQPVRIDDQNASGLYVYDSTIYPVLDDNGQVVQVAILARDVTERQHLIQELRRASEELEARVAERTAELVTVNRSLQAEIVLRQQAEGRWQKNAAHAEAVSRVASRLNAQLDLDTLLGMVCDESLAVLPGYSAALIMLYNEETDLVTPHAFAGAASLVRQVPTFRRTRYAILLPDDSKPLIIQDARSHPLTKDIKLVHQLNLCTVIIQTLRSEAELLGYLAFMSSATPRLPDEDEIRLIQGLSEHACIAIKNAQMYQRSRESQERLRALSDRLIEVREDERRVLANELHDGFGQALTVLSLSLETAAHEMQAARQARYGYSGNDELSSDRVLRRTENPELMDPVERSTIEGLRAQVSLLLQKARDLSQDLRPGVLDELGLFPALIDYCERYTRQTGVTVHLRQKGALQRFTPQEETTTFRVAQEALMNVARHAHVDEAHLLLWCDDDLLGLRIEDRGVGFEVTRFEITSALAGMQEWAALCGGSLEIESIVGRGTTLTLEIPLSADFNKEGPNDDY